MIYIYIIKYFKKYKVSHVIADTQYSLDWKAGIYVEYSRLNGLIFFVHLLVTEFNEGEISMAVSH